MDPHATTRPPAVEARGLVVRYGAVEALSGLDLSVAHGAFFGLLGPNGAGKTTAVGVLTTLTRPSDGAATLLGHDVLRERAAVRRAVGLVFQESSLDPELTPREHLDLYARLYHVDAVRRRVAEALEMVGLESHADRLVRALSGGLKRRLEIARGLLHRPRVLFLDEPTLGLDVAARAAIWSHLRALHVAGDTTIFLTTHSMEEADALCETLAIIDRGRRVVEGTPEALKASLGGDVVRIDLERGEGAALCLERVSGVRGVVCDPATGADGGARLRVAVREGPRRLAELIEAARPFGVREVTLQRPSLEHVFLHHTGHEFEAQWRPLPGAGLEP